MPAASHIEKEGTFTNTQRLVQFRDKALDPPGDARSELWFMHHLAKRVKAHYAGSERERDWPIVNLNWDYPEHGELREPDVEAVIKEINGYEVATGRPVSSFDELRSDGSTACGCWIYSGIYADGVNQARRREPGDITRRGGIVSPEWGVGVAGEPADPLQPRERRSRRAGRGPSASATCGGTRRSGAGRDTTSRTSPPTSARTTAPAPDARGMDAIGGADPFIMMGDGRGWLYSPSGLLDGPLPTHYEPLESPLPNLLYPKLDANPAAIRWRRPENPYHATGDPRYPLVATTFRLTEHHTAGGMSRTVPWLVELQPEMFAEIDPQLAADRGNRGRRLDDDRHRAGGDRGAGQGHRPHPAAAGGRPGDPPDRAAVALGLQRTLAR